MRTCLPVIVLVSSFLSLTACSSGEWPGQLNPNPTAYDHPIVKQRWDSASKQTLGSAQDVAEITAAVKKAHPDVTVREIRWLSATEVMAITVRGGDLAIGAEGFYGALKKDGDRWHVVAWYDDTI